MSRDLTQLHPKLQTLWAQLVSECAKQGLIIKNSDAMRNEAEQLAVYNAKASSLKYPNSHHNWGTAIDFFRNDGKGLYYDSDRFFTRVGKIAMSLGLEWGGSWTSPVDKPHLQLPDWGTGVAKLKSIFGTPAAFIATWNPVSVATPTPTPNPVPKSSGADTIIKVHQGWYNAQYSSKTGFKIAEDGYAGALTKKAITMAFQYEMKKLGARIAVDGDYGPKTEAAAKKYVALKKGSKGMLVHIWQLILYIVGYKNLAIDEVFGNSTQMATRDIQAKNILYVDGIAGNNSFKKGLSMIA